MKHVNLDPRLEKKKEEIMEQFRALDAPGSSANVKPKAANSIEDAPGTVPEPILRQRVTETLKTIYDPEIPINIFDLGLIYRVALKDGCAEIDMTLTTPGCPVAQTFPGMVESAVKMVPGITDAVVNLVWEPPWTQALLSEAARLELGLI